MALWESGDHAMQFLFSGFLFLFTLGSLLSAVQFCQPLSYPALLQWLNCLFFSRRSAKLALLCLQLGHIVTSCLFLMSTSCRDCSWAVWPTTWLLP